MPRLASKSTTRMSLRVGASTRRIPLTHAVYGVSAALERLDLAQRAAPFRIAVVQPRSVPGVLLGHGLPRRHRHEVDVVDRCDRVPGADGLDEVVAGVQEQHVHAGYRGLRQRAPDACRPSRTPPPARGRRPRRPTPAPSAAGVSAKRSCASSAKARSRVLGRLALRYESGHQSDTARPAATLNLLRPTKESLKTRAQARHSQTPWLGLGLVLGQHLGAQILIAAVRAVLRGGSFAHGESSSGSGGHEPGRAGGGERSPGDLQDPSRVSPSRGAGSGASADGRRWVLGIGVSGRQTDGTGNALEVDVQSTHECDSGTGHDSRVPSEPSASTLFRITDTDMRRVPPA